MMGEYISDNKDLYQSILQTLRQNGKSENDIKEVMIGQKFIIGWDEFKKIINSLKPVKFIHRSEVSNNQNIYNCDITLTGPDLYMECYFDEDNWELSFYKTFLSFPLSNSSINLSKRFDAAMRRLFLVESVCKIQFSGSITPDRLIPFWHEWKVVVFEYKGNIYSIRSNGNIRCSLVKNNGSNEVISHIDQNVDGLNSFNSKIGMYLKTDDEIISAANGNHSMFRLQLYEVRRWELIKNIQDIPVYTTDEMFLPEFISCVIQDYM